VKLKIATCQLPVSADIDNSAIDAYPGRLLTRPGLPKAVALE
jgi:hypothetical protein